jgi:hypothetical protein
MMAQRLDGIHSRFAARLTADQRPYQGPETIPK